MTMRFTIHHIILLILALIFFALIGRAYPLTDIAPREEYKDEVAAAATLTNDNTNVTHVLNLSRGYTWQVNLENSPTGEGEIRLFSSIDCINFAEIINTDPENPLPAPWTADGVVVINVSNVYYRCTRINISNTTFDSVDYTAIVSKKDGY